MSQLSEAEKRKLLRERRAAKFQKGGATDRLSKITGSNNSKLSATSPLTSSSGSTTPDVIKTPTPTSAASKRISQTFAHANDIDQDPEIEDISNFIPKESPISDPLNEQDEPPSNEDLEKILQKMLQNGVHSPDTQPGIFGNDDFLAKMMQQSSSPFPGQQQQQQQPQVDHQENQIKFEKFKNRFTIFRLTLLLSLLITSLFSYDLKSSSIKIDYANEFAPKFQQSFIILEILFFIIHFINIQKYEYHPGGGIISSVLPLISQFVSPNLLHIIKLIPSYMDIYKILQIDISLVIFYFGIISIL